MCFSTFYFITLHCTLNFTILLFTTCIYCLKVSNCFICKVSSHTQISVWKGSWKTLYEILQETKNPRIYVLICIKQRFSTGGEFCFRRDIWQCLETLYISTTRVMGAAGNQWLEARGPAKMSTMHRTSSPQGIIWPKIIQTK